MAMLESKRVFEDVPSNRERVVETLREPYDGRCRERARRLLAATKDVRADPASEKRLHRWSREEFPFYDDIPFLDDREFRVQRFQPSGLCNLHAPIVAQYYARCFAARQKNKTDSPVDMVDATAYVREGVQGLALARYIIHGTVFPSQLTLKDLLEPRSNVASTSWKAAPNLLLKHGPALVSTFEIHADFKDPRVHKHYGQPQGPKVEDLHAMVLVATRHEEKDDKLFFLLQNFHLEKQFVEIDLEYAEASKATLHFVETPQAKLRDGLTTFAGHVAKTEAFLMPDSYILNGGPGTYPDEEGNFNPLF